ncbi:MAG TPA: hypothetical protein P5534_04005, partial [Candidatus Paceibacterota bacterium]|nr:hypothetical protein [Candidatus Paceibacterota bacterium]
MDNTSIDKPLVRLGIQLALAVGLTAGLLAAPSAGAAENAEAARQDAAAAPPGPAREHPLFAGWASVDITPRKPVNLVGQ